MASPVPSSIETSILSSNPEPAGHSTFMESAPRRPSAGAVWGKSPVPSPAAPSLADVMSEQLATDLGKQELHLVQKSVPDLVTPSTPVADVVPDEILAAKLAVEPSEEEQSDYLIAQMLQYEADLEHDELLKRKERHYNGTSKVSVSMSNYRYLHPVESRDELSDVVDFDEPKLTSPKPPEFNSKGYAGKGKNIVTKHDPDVCGRRNADRVMAFPPGFDTGDDSHYDQKIPNTVFNQLKVHSIKEAHRGHRVKDRKEDDATATMAVDAKTRILMYKLVNGGTLETINGVISTGKESVVFHATGGVVDDVKLPEECAIKVFKTTLNEFRNRDPYIKDDYRFQERFSKLNPRKIVKFWAEKEMLNLKRMVECGVPCPDPVLLKKHILVLRFLGKDQVAAPKLKDVTLSSQQKKQAYKECLEIMKKMYSECKLVHADFSEYNLLWHEDKVWVIDVSQSVEPAHPRGLEFLYRDCSNVYSFFTRIGVENVLSVKDLFHDITGIWIEGTGQQIFSELERHQTKKEKPHKYNSELDGASFDHLYDLAVSERMKQAEENEDDWENISDDSE